MLDVKALTEQFFKSVTIRERDDAVFVTPHFFHLDSDESIALRFTETPDGRPIVTDCGTTRDYLELMDIDLNDHRDKLNAIKERFFIEYDDGAVTMTIPTDNPPTVMSYLGYFIQAISIIANIDL